MLFSNDLKEGALLSPGLPKLLTRFNTFLVAMTVKEYQFYVFSPSLLAAAIVLASRKALKVTYVGPMRTPTCVCECERAYACA